MAYGTLIGTIRHGGFIPWDDDVDIMMLREDYEIFLAEAHKYLHKHLFIQSIYTEPEYMLNFVKIRNKKITFIETGSEDLKITHGVFIDIFPLDCAIESDKMEVYNFRKIVYDFRIYMELDKSKNKMLRTVVRKNIAKIEYRYAQKGKSV